MGRTFDFKSDEFTLEKIVEWGFDQFADKINEISGAATKELNVEMGLVDIAAAWEAMEFDIVPYKDAGHYKIRSVCSAATSEKFSALYCVFNIGPLFILLQNCVLELQLLPSFLFLQYFLRQLLV